MQKKDLQLTLNICGNLSEQFPHDELYNHVSLTLSGKLYDNDFRFLSGYSDYYEIADDITGEIRYFQEGVRWNTIDLDLSGIDPEICYISKLNEIKGLKNIIFPIGYQATGLKFSGKENTMQSLVVSDGTTEIDKESFIRWVSLTDVQFPKSLERIAPEAFVGCSSLQSFDFPEGTDRFMICDGVLFSTDKTILIAFPPGLNIEKYEIPQGTTLIAERAFKQNPYIKEIVIPASVVRIQDYAFENCASLEKIEVDSANPVYYSRYGILYEKNIPVLVPYFDMLLNEHRNIMLCVPAAIGFTKLSIRNDLLAAKCFSGCKNIKTISYDCGDYYSHRIDGAFDNCSEIEEISLKHVEALPRLTDCQKLKKLNIEGCREYHSVNGVVFNKDDELIYYPPAKEDDKNRLDEEIVSSTQKIKKAKHKGKKKTYEIKGIVVGTWNKETVPINISLYDDELEQIKTLIKQSPDCDDLRYLIEDAFPELHDIIQEKLIGAAYEYYVREGIDDGMTQEEAEEVELMGNEYSCPIPEDWK